MSDPMPVFVIKAKDNLAPLVIADYRRRALDHELREQAGEVHKALDEVLAWRDRNPELCQDPDHRHVPVTTDREYATGGPVVITKPLIVGEQGPEMVTVHARNCERCGGGFTTTIERRLCNECYRSDLAAGTTIHPQPEATDG